MLATAPAPDLAQLAAGIGDEADMADQILSRFVGWVEAKGLSLYPAQEEAILELLAANTSSSTRRPVGQVAGRRGAALHGARAGQGLLLHVPDQGAGQREVLRALRRVRRRATSAC